MADIIKLDMTNIWASGGDKVAPLPAKIAQGWLVEVVPRQTWNWFENRQDQNIAYLLQKGFPEWDNYTEFLANKSWVNYNGTIYKALLTGINQNPSTATTYWVKAFPESSAALESIRTLVPAADRLAYYTGTNTAALTVFTAFARTLLDDTTNTAARTTLGAQTLHPNLTAMSTGLVAAVNVLPYFDSTTSMAGTNLTAFARLLLDDTDAAAAQATLDLIPMSSVSDATSNRVMKTGAFGLGGTGITIGDASVVLPSGVYTCTSGTVNTPLATSATLFVMRWNATACTQLYQPVFNSKLYTRSCNNSTVWSAWAESASTDAPIFTGIPRAPTAAVGDNGTQLATTAFTQAALATYGLFPSSANVFIAAGVDLNTMTTPGFYGQNTNANATLVLNYPLAAKAGTLVVAKAGNNITSQTYQAYSTSEQWIRSGTSGTWSAWAKVYTTAEVSSAVAAFLDTADQNAARTSLLAAKSGANTDITSLTGVTLGGTTTVLGSVAETAVAVASAATTDIGAVASNVVSITGTTTITSLGTSSSGTRKQVRFTGVLTLTHNATSLNLPGNANIVTAADDFAEFRCTGGTNWICTMYTRTSGQNVVVNSVANGGTGVTTATGTGSVVLSASPTLTGVPLAPTATAGTNTTQLATTAFVAAGLALKANLASPTFTGTPLAPTATAGTNNTQIATTAFVTTQISALGIQPQLSPVDGTVGRLMGVGAFGVGVTGNNVPQVTNLNTTVNVGFYRFDGAAGGVPPQFGGSGGSVIVHSLGGLYVQQIAMSVTASTSFPAMAYRVSDNAGTWGTWVTMYNQGNILGAVTQTSSIPTGAIIETGSNAAGRFTKFANGMIIAECAPFNMTVTANGTTISGDIGTPTTFNLGSGVVSCQGQPTVSNVQFGFVNCYMTSATSFKVVHYNGPSAQTMAACSATIIGRWF